MNARALNIDVPPAPPAYQAEVLRGQICDDLNRQFFRDRQQLIRTFEDRKDQIQRDAEKLSAEEFLTKYRDWKFM